MLIIDYYIDLKEVITKNDNKINDNHYFEFNTWRMWYYFFASAHHNGKKVQNKVFKCLLKKKRDLTTIKMVLSESSS